MAGKTDKTDTYTGEAKTRKNKARVLEVLAENCGNIYAACNSLSLSRAQFYAWLDDDEKFASDYNDLKERLVDTVESNLFSMIFEGERHSDRIKASEIYLKAHGKKRGYGVEKREQEHSGDLNVNNKVVVVRMPRNGREPEGN